jgi:hypothetical protein
VHPVSLFSEKREIRLELELYAEPGTEAGGG